MLKYINTLLLLLSSISSFFAYFLLRTAGMLDTWLGSFLEGAYSTGIFPQTIIPAPKFFPVKAEAAMQVADYNLELSKSIPIYFDFTIGSFRFVFFFIGLILLVAFLYNLYLNIKDSCKK